MRHYYVYLSPPRGRMKIHNTINMCEQKCISEQYSNCANLLKREIEGILKNVHVYLEKSHFKSLWSNRSRIQINTAYCIYQIKINKQPKI